MARLNAANGSDHAKKHSMNRLVHTHSTVQIACLKAGNAVVSASMNRWP